MPPIEPSSKPTPRHMQALEGGPCTRGGRPSHSIRGPMQGHSGIHWHACGHPCMCMRPRTRRRGASMPMHGLPYGDAWMGPRISIDGPVHMDPPRMHVHPWPQACASMGPCTCMRGIMDDHECPYGHAWIPARHAMDARTRSMRLPLVSKGHAHRHAGVPGSSPGGAAHGARGGSSRP